MTSLDFLQGKDGGAERDRTAGLLVANEALSQLSYSPTTFISLPATYHFVKNRANSSSRRQSLLVNLFQKRLRGL